MNRAAAIVAILGLALSTTACRQNEQIATQTSEVVVLDEQPETLDPFDKEFLVDGERAMRIGNGVSPPRRISRGPRVKTPISERQLCFPGASIIVVVDKTGAVRETEIVSVEPAIEYVGSERRVLDAEESRDLIERSAFAIRNWEYEPAMKDGAPVPVLVEGGWHMSCR